VLGCLELLTDILSFDFTLRSGKGATTRLSSYLRSSV
jgi:hypothetical protein